MRLTSFLKKIAMLLFGIAVIMLLTMVVLSAIASNTETNNTVQITRGTISVYSNVSGDVEVRQTATLSFPTSGIVQEIFKSEGEQAVSGEILASLVQDTLIADYNAALSNLDYQSSLKEELLRGPQAEAREVTETNVNIAKENLTHITEEYARIVQNAYENLLSADLAAYPKDVRINDIAPTITGHYACDNEGSYALDLYHSNSVTGYSYSLSGLESGQDTIRTSTPVPLGDCGLFIQFSSDDPYQNGTWIIEIPNKRGASYQTNLNAYKLAVEQQKKAITQATLGLELALNSAKNTNALPSKEALGQANARLDQARATLANREAQIANYVIKAPFDGTITDIDMKVGETVNTSNGISIIGNGTYELKARIPEVDIRTVHMGDPATVIFDAAPDQPIFGTIEYISPLSKDIDGVAYYEARVHLANEPAWLREGLNADIDILTQQKIDVLVVPRQYVFTEKGSSYVFVKDGSQKIKTAFIPGLVGNDGYIEVTNLPEGITIVTP